MSKLIDNFHTTMLHNILYILFDIQCFSCFCTFTVWSYFDNCLTFFLIRVSDCEDLEMSESDVTKLVANIEMEMFDIFRNTDSKYMNKYRTIMFNLKDPRNKVCSVFISTMTVWKSYYAFEYCQYHRIFFF